MLSSLAHSPPKVHCSCRLKLFVAKITWGVYVLQTTNASVATRLEPGATSRTDARVSGTVNNLLPSSWNIHRRNLCNRLLHRKLWWKLRSYCFGSCMHVWHNKPHRCYGLWHDRQFASQQLEHSSEELVQQAPPMNVGESFTATALVHVCRCGLVIFDF